MSNFSSERIACSAAFGASQRGGIVEGECQNTEGGTGEEKNDEGKVLHTVAHTTVSVHERTSGKLQ